MMSDRDDIDPNDWLASQFEDEPEPIKPPQPAAAQPTSEFRPADRLPTAGPSAVPPVNQPSGEPAGGFVWGLTPGGGDSAPIEPPAPEPIPSWPAVALSAAPALPPAAVMPTAPALPPAAVLPPAPALPPAEAFPPAPGGAGERWNYDPLEQPTRAIEQPGSAFQQPGPVLEQPGSAIERAPLPWETPAVDYSLQGATEAMWAEPIGLADPVDEG
ncbi:MAG: hypothetical protein LH471_09810, partial [Salinibacterium sp.]|nr:hypothetical protein [Salinibacterium sp.]